MPPGKGIFFLLQGVALLQATQATPPASIEITKCCPEGEVLYVLESKPLCIKLPDEVDRTPRPIDNVKIIALDKTDHNTTDEMVLRVSQIGEIPSCKTEHHEIRTETHDVTSMLTLQKGLYISKYEPGNYIKKFCIDRHSKTDELIALMCDQCEEKGIPCIQKRCPHGQKIKERKCEEGNYKPIDFKFWNESTGKSVDFEKNTHYLVVAPTSGKFCKDCPFSKAPPNATLLTDGRLKAIFKNKTYIWPPEKIVYSASSDEFKYLNVRDVPAEEHNCNEAARAILSISIFFLVVTFILYAAVKTLRNSINSKMTMALVLNLLLTFILHLVKGHLELNRKTLNKNLETAGCVLLGYTYQYFFLASFFWMNTMAFIIYMTASNMYRAQRVERRMSQLIYFAYAQGMPLLIVLITLYVDSKKPESGEVGYDTSFPNVGKYRCFLGNMRIEPRPYYVTTAHFLYFSGLVLILLFTNLILIGLSVLHIREPFKNKIKLLRAQEKNTTEEEKNIHFQELKMCFYFFVITGIMWFFDLLSSLIVGRITTEEYLNTCTLRLLLDIPWLSSGFLIFLVTIVKNREIVYKGLREKYRFLVSRADGKQDSQPSDFITTTF